MIDAHACIELDYAPKDDMAELTKFCFKTKAVTASMQKFRHSLDNCGFSTRDKLHVLASTKMLQSCIEESFADTDKCDRAMRHLALGINSMTVSVKASLGKNLNLLRPFWLDLMNVCTNLPKAEHIRPFIVIPDYLAPNFAMSCKKVDGAWCTKHADTCKGDSLPKTSGFAFGCCRCVKNPRAPTHPTIAHPGQECLKAIKHFVADKKPSYPCLGGPGPRNCSISYWRPPCPIGTNRAADPECRHCRADAHFCCCTANAMVAISKPRVVKRLPSWNAPAGSSTDAPTDAPTRSPTIAPSQGSAWKAEYNKIFAGEDLGDASVARTDDDDDLPLETDAPTHAPTRSPTALSDYYKELHARAGLPQPTEFALAHRGGFTKKFWETHFGLQKWGEKAEGLSQHYRRVVHPGAELSKMYWETHSSPPGAKQAPAVACAKTPLATACLHEQMSCKTVGCGNKGVYRGNDVCSCHSDCTPRSNPGAVRAEARWAQNATTAKTASLAVVLARNRRQHECCSDFQFRCGTN
jgi:hypothetical protein